MIKISAVIGSSTGDGVTTIVKREFTDQDTAVAWLMERATDPVTRVVRFENLSMVQR